MTEDEQSTINLATEDEQPTINLASVLKLSGFADTGGEAKMLIQGGDVLVNGVVETRRKHKLVEGDVITVRGEEFVLELEDESQDVEDVEDVEDVATNLTANLEDA